MAFGYSRSSFAENPLKKREDSLWNEFANTGKMPAVPVLNDDDSVRRAHTILDGAYNQLQKVLDGEALAKMGALSDPEADVQIEAAGWVLKMINSAKRAYVNKDAMTKSFLTFKAASANKRMTLVCGLDKGSVMLKEAAEPEKLVLAEKFLARLLSLAEADARNPQLEEFIRLSISVGWTFAKADKYDALSQVLKLLPVDTYNLEEHFRKNIDALRDKMRFVEEQPLRAWMTRAKDAVAPNATADVVQPLLDELLPLVGIGGWHNGPVRMRDGGMFESRQVAFLRLCQLAKKFKNGQPLACAQTILQIFKRDGLQNLSCVFFERRDKEVKIGEKLPPRAKPYWPALSEEMAKLIVSSCKVCYGRRTPGVGSPNPDLEWAISFLEEVYSRYDDDEWSDFRIGKLLIWSKELDRAKERLLPVIRKKQSEFWAWDLLGDLFPGQRKACVAKALLCEADEIYVKGLKHEAGLLGLNVEDHEALVRASEPTWDLLLSGITPVSGILLERFKTPEGKTRLVFSDGTGRDSVPLSPKAARLPKDATVGFPVIMYRSPDDEKQIVAVKLRPDGHPWDVLPVEPAVFLDSFIDKNGKRISSLAIRGIRFLSFHEVTGCVPGTPVKVRFSDRIREGKDPECVWAEKDVSPDRSRWDVMDVIHAVFVEAYSNDKGRVNVFVREGSQYKLYGEDCHLVAGAPVDIFVLGKPDKERIYQPGMWSMSRRPGTFLAPKPDTKCYDVMPSSSPDRFKWDAMYRAVVVYCGKSKSGTSMTLSSGKAKFNAPQEKFEVLKDAALGDAFEIRYKVRVKDNEKIRDIVACVPSSENPELISEFSGTIRMATGIPPAGYVDLYDDDGEDDFYEDDDGTYCERERHSYGSVFISSEFIQGLHLLGGEVLTGTAVRLPSKIHTSKRGNMYENKRYQAISVQLATMQGETGRCGCSL